MAHFVLKDASATINSVDLSDHVRDITVTYAAEEVDDTNMGDDGRGRIAGLTDWSATITFAQDLAAGDVDATLFSLVGAASFACVFKNDSGAVAATNPSYTGNAILTDYQPVSGAVGDLATASITLKGDGVLTRATS